MKLSMYEIIYWPLTAAHNIHHISLNNIQLPPSPSGQCGGALITCWPGVPPRRGLCPSAGVRGGERTVGTPAVSRAKSNAPRGGRPRPAA